MTESTKIYIMSPACSGKTTFAKQHPSFAGLQVVDYEDLLPPVSLLTNIVLFVGRVIPPVRYLALLSPAFRASHRQHYYDGIFAFLRSQRVPSVVFGRKPPEDLSPYGDIKFGIVIIPYEQHAANARSRKGQMRNPIPFFDHWSTDIEKLAKMRDVAKRYAERHALPIFESFEAAITGLARPLAKPVALDERRTAHR